MSTTFASLGVDPALVDALTAQGLAVAFPIQAMTIPDALAGRDVSGKAKTGSGKTLAFGLPMLQRVPRAEGGRPRGLVLVPTRELANQVTDVLEPLGRVVDRRVTAIYGGANMDQHIKALAKGTDVVVATPGRLIDLVDRKAVALDDVEIVVVDEADRMADMGFLPQVEWILRHIEGGHQTLLFSATLDGVVDTLVQRYQDDPVLYEVESAQVTVEQMQHRFIQVHEMDKVRVAAAIVRGADRSMLFTRTKRAADLVARKLRDEGVDAKAIHGDLRQKEREKALADFTEGRLHALVATDVAARGLHIDEVDVVIHYDPPEDHKTYLHRSGRTARAGESGLVVTLVLWNEELEVKRMMKRLQLDAPIVEMFSNDPRLGDLAAWDPSADAVTA